MIVKVRTIDDGWEYYDAPNGVKVRALTKEQIKYVLELKDQIYIITNYLEPKSIEQLFLVNIFDKILIYTDRVVYLLNDDGKTIEKLT